MECRICYKKIDKPFISLGNMPLSNSLIIDPRIVEQYYPLDAYVCPDCFLVQSPEFGLAKNIFSAGYPYFSSYSETWLKHCKDYVDTMIEKYGYDTNSFVAEIGSNDGYLLQYFKEYNIPILGIEPAESVAITAIKKKIPTDIEYFDTNYAKKMAKEGKQADLIIGNNVLAHNPNLHDFVEGLKHMLKPYGIITMEFPFLLNLVEHNQFDTIYHEHFSYFSLYAARKLFQRHGFVIFDVEEIPTHGGSIRIYVKHIEDDKKPLSDNVNNLTKKENDLYNIDTYNNFNNKVLLIKRELLKLLIGLKDDNKTIIGYGAPAKGNTLLNYCGIGTDFIDYVVDANPYKQGKFTPGSHIPIINPDKIKEDKPDYVIILPWNIKEEIINSIGYIKEWGGKFIIPIPKPIIV